jgi:hypothetical protein
VQRTQMTCAMAPPPVSPWAARGGIAVIETAGQHTGRPSSAVFSVRRGVGVADIDCFACHPQHRGQPGKKSRPGVISRSSCCMSFGYGLRLAGWAPNRSYPTGGGPILKATGAPRMPQAASSARRGNFYPRHSVSWLSTLKGDLHGYHSNPSVEIFD